MQIFLIGPMGAGKSTIGRALAKRLGLNFVDSDQQIEQQCGASIPVIFAHEGEQGFRIREAQVIDMLSQRPDCVLATGGGTVLLPENRQRLRSRGFVVYLHVVPATLYVRTRGDRNRPLLQTEDPRARIEELYAQRDPLYKETAHAIVEAGRSTPSAVSRQIAALAKMHVSSSTS